MNITFENWLKAVTHPTQIITPPPLELTHSLLHSIRKPHFTASKNIFKYKTATKKFHKAKPYRVFSPTQIKAQDFFNLFGNIQIDESSTRESILKAYKKIAFKIHPDTHSTQKEHWTHTFHQLQAHKNSLLEGAL